MKKRADDPDMPVGRLTKIPDYLPPPSELAAPDETIKVTIVLNRSSVLFFKHAAQKYHTKYQKMIRRVLDHYASHYGAA